MLASLPATLSTSSSTSCIFLLLPTMLPKRNCPSSFCLSSRFSPTQVAALDRALEHRQQRVRLDRLLDEAVRAGLHRLDRLRHAAVAGDDDHFGLGIGLLELAEQLEPVRVRQHHVGHDDVGLPGLEDLLAPGADHRGPDLVALVLEQDLQPLDHRRLVVDRQDSALLLGRHHWFSLARPGLRSRDRRDAWRSPKSNTTSRKAIQKVYTQLGPAS